MANIEVSLRNGCAIVILNRPEIRNAFDDSLIANLAKTLKKLDADDAVRAVVLMGAGTAFCAGVRRPRRVHSPAPRRRSTAKTSSCVAPYVVPR